MAPESHMICEYTLYFIYWFKNHFTHSSLKLFLNVKKVKAFQI